MYHKRRLSSHDFINTLNTQIHNSLNRSEEISEILANGKVPNTLELGKSILNYSINQDKLRRSASPSDSRDTYIKYEDSYNEKGTSSVLFNISIS